MNGRALRRPLPQESRTECWDHHPSATASLESGGRSIRVDHLRCHLGRGDAGHAMRGADPSKNLLHEGQEALFLNGCQG